MPVAARERNEPAAAMAIAAVGPNSLSGIEK
jgi:hypothetical protein